MTIGNLEQLRDALAKEATNFGQKGMATTIRHFDLSPFALPVPEDVHTHSYCPHSLQVCGVLNSEIQ